MAEFTGRVRRVRLDSKYHKGKSRMRVIVTGDTSQQVKTVSVKFSEPFGGPTPLTNPCVCEFIKYDPEKQRSVFRNTKMMFESDATDYSYQVFTTMLDANGKPLGNTQEFSVVVEDVDDNAPA